MKSTKDMKEGAAQALFSSVEFKPPYSAPIMLLFVGGLQLKVYMLPRSIGKFIFSIVSLNPSFPRA